jgi:hypothetical protein
MICAHVGCAARRVMARGGMWFLRQAWIPGSVRTAFAVAVVRYYDRLTGAR